MEQKCFTPNKGINIPTASSFIGPNAKTIPGRLRLLRPSPESMVTLNRHSRQMEKNFSSVPNRPLDGSNAVKDYDIWYVEKRGNVWSEPANAGEVVNTRSDEFYPSPTSSGNLYFTAEYEHGVGKEDIFVCRWENGKYTPEYTVGHRGQFKDMGVQRICIS